jgi:hypothetical protein
MREGPYQDVEHTGNVVNTAIEHTRLILAGVLRPFVATLSAAFLVLIAPTPLGELRWSPTAPNVNMELTSVNFTAKLLSAHERDAKREAEGYPERVEVSRVAGKEDRRDHD